jgi:hypothetical protein
MKVVPFVLPFGRSRLVRSGNLPSMVIRASCAATMKTEISHAITACPKTTATRLRTACATRLLPLLLVLALPAVVRAQFTFTTNNGTITTYTESGGPVTIPSTINGLPVTSIGDGAFSGCYNLTTCIKIGIGLRCNSSLLTNSDPTNKKVNT